MMNNFDDILLELGYRVPEGIVDLTKDYQVKELVNILKENGYSDANEIAQKARVYFSYIKEIDEANPVSKVDKILQSKVRNTDTGNDITVQSALQYKNAKNKGQRAAYGQAVNLLKKAGVSDKELGGLSKKTNKPTAPKANIGVSGAEKKTQVKAKKDKQAPYTPTESQVKSFTGQKKVLVDVIERGFLATTEKLKKGVGVFDPSDEQLKSLVDITKKQLKTPSYRLKLPTYKIEDKDIDIALGIVKNRLGNEEYKKWERGVTTAGAVDSFLTTGEAGKERFRDIVKKYLEQGGRSAITGKFVPFNRMQLDHHVPYSSAAQAVADKKKKGIKTTLEAEKDRLDSPPNWDLMETELNQFKNSLEGNELIAKAAKRLNMSPDEKELKKIQQALQVLQRDQLFTNLVTSFGKKDFSGFNEQTIGKLNANDAGMLAKAWNYWHPNPKTPEFRDNVKNDPNYITKLKKAGIDPEKVHPLFVYRYQAQVGGSRTRGVVKPPAELKKSIYQSMKKAGVVSSKKQTIETDTALAKAILSIEKQSKDLTSREKELKARIKQRQSKK
jgi:hypothetical protein